MPAGRARAARHRETGEITDDDTVILAAKIKKELEEKFEVFPDKSKLR
jgi:hypothetical protein